MEFKPINFLEKLIPFLESSPFGIEKIYVIPLSQQTFAQLATKNMNGLAYGGHSPPQTSFDVLGNAESRNQANFYLQFLYRFVDEVGNEEATNIISSFEQWIVFENARFQQASESKKNPLFPYFGDDPLSFSIAADGGSLIAPRLEKTPHYAIYQVAIRIKYKTNFDLEDDY